MSVTRDEFFCMTNVGQFTGQIFASSDLKRSMAKKKDEYLVIPVEEKEMDERQSPNESTDPAEEELEEKFDKEFWLKVMHNIVVIR